MEKENKNFTREIKLKGVDNHLRSFVVSAKVDENTVHFQEGVALVEAEITYKKLNNKLGTYVRKGLINEKFEECFSADSFVAKDLMFLPCNQEILRCGPYDFITKVEKWNDCQRGVEFHHVRIVSGVPAIIRRDLKDVLPTDKESIVVTGHQFYNVENGIFLTRQFSQVDKVVGSPGGYYLTDILTEEECLRIGINLDFQLTGHIFSYKNMDWLKDSDQIHTLFDYEVFREGYLEICRREQSKCDCFLLELNRIKKENTKLE